MIELSCYNIQVLVKEANGTSRYVDRQMLFSKNTRNNVQSTHISMHTDVECRVTPALPDKPTDNREKSGQTSVTLTSSILSFLSRSLPIPLQGHAFLSYHWKIDP